MVHGRTRQARGGSRRVALAAFHFPPAGWGGVQRPAKWVKYLPRHGWDALVLTVTPEAYEVRDESLGSDLGPEVPVLRCRLPRPPLVGDPGLRWLPSLASRAGRLFREGRADVLLLTGSPFFSFLAGPLLESASGLPYVLDFRDPWTVSPWWPDPPGLKASLKAAAGRLVEAAAVRRAARCLFAQPGVAARYAEAYPDLAGGRAVTLPNGYDEDDFPAAGLDPGPPPARRRYRILYTGTWDADRPPDLILRALALLRDRGLGERIEARFVGLSRVDGPGLAAELGLEGMVRFEGYLPHDRCTRMLREADLLWLDNGLERDYVSGKIFEYMASGRPVVAAAHPEGIAARWLREAGTATIVGRDPSEAADAIQEMVGALDRGRRPLPREEAVRRFSRDRQTGLLARVLEEACGR